MEVLTNNLPVPSSVNQAAIWTCKLIQSQKLKKEITPYVYNLHQEALNGTWLGMGARGSWSLITIWLIV